MKTKVFEIEFWQMPAEMDERSRKDFEDIRSLHLELRGSKQAISLERVRRFFSSGGWLCVARDVNNDRSIVGIASLSVRCSIDKVLGNLERVVTKEQFQRRGVGRSLVEALIQKAREVGCERLRLTYDTDKIHLGRFYRSFGFVDGYLNSTHLKLEL